MYENAGNQEVGEASRWLAALHLHRVFKIFEARAKADISRLLVGSGGVQGTPKDHSEGPIASKGNMI